MGFINTLKDQFLRPEYWVVNNPALINLKNGDWLLTGYRNEKFLNELRDYFAERNTSHWIEREFENCPKLITLTNLEEDDFDHIKNITLKTTNRSINIFADGMKALSSRLPKLSVLIPHLTQRPIVGINNTTEKWNTLTAKWESAHVNHSPGAYRMNQPQKFYYLRTLDDLSNDTMRLADVRLVKFFAHLSTFNDHEDSQPIPALKGLIGYHPENDEKGTLYVPIGADLPGLYGRAVALDSGRPPEVQGEHLQYPDVSAETASLITQHLNS